MQFLKVTPNTGENSKLWKFWHGINIFIAGWCFLLGSIFLFPRLESNVAAYLCGWFYTIGSACFLLADLTQWVYFLEQHFRYMSYVVNFFINVIGSVLYLIGSIFFIPNVMEFYMGVHLFIVGAGLVMIAQAWKLWRVLHHEQKSPWECLKEDKLGIFLDSMAFAGAALYFGGSFVFEFSINNNYLTMVGAVTFTVGSCGNTISAVLVFYRYFFQKTQTNDDEDKSPEMELKTRLSSTLDQ